MMMLKFYSIILMVAFLFCSTECAGKRIDRKIRKYVLQSTSVDEQRASRASLIIPTAQNVVREGQKSESKDQKIIFSSKSSKKKTRKKTYITQRLTQIEARLGEIPVPLMVQALDATENGKGGYQIVYETELSDKDLAAFYCQEMARSEWSLITMIEGEENFYSFKKNGQMCTILVRPVVRWWGTKKHRLHLYVQV